MAPLRIELTWRTALLVVGTLATVWLFLQLWPILIVVVVALMIVGMLNPVVAWLERRRVRRTHAIALVWTAMVVVSGAFAASALPSLVAQIGDLLDRLPQLQADLAHTIGRTKLGASLGEKVGQAHSAELLAGAARQALSYSPKVIELLAYAVSTAFLALYLMIDRDRMRGALFSLVPRKHHVKLSSILLKLETIVGGYMRGQLVTSAMMGVFTFVVLAIAKVPNALALALVAAVADVLPYVGALLACGPAFLATLQRGPTAALIVLGALAVYQELESRIIIPRVYGRVLRLPAATVMLSLLVGGKLLGILGALLALPIAAAMRMLVDELRVKLPGEEREPFEARARDEAAERAFEVRAVGAPPIEAAAIATDIAAERTDDAEPPPPSLRHRTT